MIDPNSPVTWFAEGPKLWCRIDGRSPRRCSVDIYPDGDWTVRVDCLVSELDYFTGRLGGEPAELTLIPPRPFARVAGRAYVVLVINEPEHGARVHLRGASRLVLDGQ